jgi:hypothetical protein
MRAASGCCSLIQRGQQKIRLAHAEQQTLGIDEFLS